MTDGGNAPQFSRGMPSHRVRSEHLKDVGTEECQRGIEMRDGGAWSLGPFWMKLNNNTRINDKLWWDVILPGVCCLMFAHRMICCNIPEAMPGQSEALESWQFKINNGSISAIWGQKKIHINKQDRLFYFFMMVCQKIKRGYILFLR